MGHLRPASAATTTATASPAASRPKTPVYGNTFMPAAGAKALNKDPKGLTVAIIAEDTDAARSGLGTLGDRRRVARDEGRLLEGRRAGAAGDGG